MIRLRCALPLALAISAAVVGCDKSVDISDDDTTNNYYTELVGPAGAVLQFAGATVRIPAGALPEATEIQMGADPELSFM